MKKKILALAGATAVLFGCYGPATGQVSPSGTGYTATYSKQFQIDAGFPIIFITYQCHGENFFRNTTGINVNDVRPADGDTIKIAAYCASGFANAFPNDAHS